MGSFFRSIFALICYRIEKKNWMNEWINKWSNFFRNRWQNLSFKWKIIQYKSDESFYSSVWCSNSTIIIIRFFPLSCVSCWNVCSSSSRSSFIFSLYHIFDAWTNSRLIVTFYFYLYFVQKRWNNIFDYYSFVTLYIKIRSIKKNACLCICWLLLLLPIDRPTLKC